MKRLLLLFILTNAAHLMNGQNVGINTTTPRYPLSFNTGNGDKLSLFDDGNPAGLHFGIGVQSGALLQVFTPTVFDNIAFGAGKSDAFTELVRFTGSGNIGVGTSSPSAYGHGGTNKVIEIYNPGTAGNSQSHVILSTGSLSGSAGSVTWTSAGITSLEKRVALIAAIFDGTATPASPKTMLNFFTNDGSAVNEKMRITSEGYVGIGTMAPRAPLSFPATVGQKIILWDDGNVAGGSYGIGVQSARLQIHSYISTDNIVFGYGSSTAMTERARIINSGADGLSVNGRIVLRNGTLPNDPAQGPGIWLYKPDNLGALLGFIGAQNNQNMGFFGGPGGWGFTYDAINSRVGIGTNTPGTPLEVKGQLTVDQRAGGLYGGLLLKGNAPNSNYPNVGFSLRNTAGNDIVAALVQGDIINNTANTESIDLTFYTANSGFGSLSEKFRIKGNGAITVSGNAGGTGQFLTSSGSNAAPVWKSMNEYITTAESGSTNLPMTGTSPHNLTGSDFVINLSRPAKVMLFGRIALQKNCGVGVCDTKASVTVFLNGVSNMAFGVTGSNFGGETQNNYTTNFVGPKIYDLPAGTHTFTFTATNMFNEPQLSFTAQALIIYNN